MARWPTRRLPAIGQQYLTNSSLRPDYHADSGDRTWFITMNLSTPPFDDIHVREAVNDIIDKAGLLKAWGGPTHGQIATHVMPPTILDNQLTSSFDPYATPGEAGVPHARQAADDAVEVRPQARRDVRRRCVPGSGDDQSELRALDGHGIQSWPRTWARSASGSSPASWIPAPPTRPSRPSGTRSRIALNAGWGKDYADPYTFAEPLFSSSSIIPSGNVNYSLVGLTRSQASSYGDRLPRRRRAERRRHDQPVRRDGRPAPSEPAG